MFFAFYLVGSLSRKVQRVWVTEKLSEELLENTDSRILLSLICLCLQGWSSKISFFFLLICLFLAVLGLHFCARAFSSCGKRGPLFSAVRGPLTIAASLVAEHRLQTRRLSSCGSRA